MLLLAHGTKRLKRLTSWSCVFLCMQNKSYTKKLRICNFTVMFPDYACCLLLAQLRQAFWIEECNVFSDDKRENKLTGGPSSHLVASEEARPQSDRMIYSEASLICGWGFSHQLNHLNPCRSAMLEGRPRLPASVFGGNHIAGWKRGFTSQSLHMRMEEGSSSWLQIKASLNIHTYTYRAICSLWQCWGGREICNFQEGKSEFKEMLGGDRLSLKAREQSFYCYWLQAVVWVPSAPVIALPTAWRYTPSPWEQNYVTLQHHFPGAKPWP